MAWCSAGVLLLLVLLLFIGSLVPLPGDARTPSGLKRDRALYVTASDGTRIAIDVWLPAGYRGGGIPTIIRATRYGRAREVKPLGRLLWKVGLLDDPVFASNVGPTLGVDHFSRRGYAVVVIDGRGSGASFGSRRAECAPEEIRDFGEVLDWIVRQPWSNERVGAWGISQDGLNIEMLAGQGRPQLKAIAPLYTTMDSQFTTAGDGGVYNRENVIKWAAFNHWADLNKSGCTAGQWLCELKYRFILGGAKPVDGPDGRKLLRQAVAQRHNYDVVQGWGSLLYREDPLGKSGLSMKDIMPYGVKAKIEATRVPIFSYYGWQDAGLSYSGLVHYINFSNPQIIAIGPFSHGARFNADPYRPDNPPPKPNMDQQLEQVADFFDRYVKASAPPPQSHVTYYTLGSNLWRDTESWPPAGLAQQSFFLGNNGTAASTELGQGADPMKVDFNTSSGVFTRYRSIIDASDIDYPGRARTTARLLHYDSPPLDADQEFTGSGIARLFLSTTGTDGAIFVYVDDIGPDGHAYYLTEGVLRLLFNKPLVRPPPYKSLAVDRGYWKEEAAPLQPGRTYSFDVELFPISALIRRGHRLRFSFAGADSGSMSRVPPTGPAPILTLYHSQALPSAVLLPMRPWRQSSSAPSAPHALQ
jgi:putative CocE/NonD family hydrolase